MPLVRRATVAIALGFTLLAVSAPITKEKDTHTLRYDWFLSLDGTACEVREAYTGPEGLIEHNRNILDART